MPRLISSVIASVVFVPVVAFAGNGDLASGGEDPLIWGGSNVESCGWPTTVRVTSGNSLCTGTLIHPRVVVYAAHCGVATTIAFGEANSFRTVPEQFCQVNPAWSGSQGNDWAFCVLSEDVPLPITPAVFGCETSSLFNGQDIALVGFGNNSGSSGAGTKRWGMSTMFSLDFNSNTVQVAGSGQPTVCSGDSGGPLFVQYPDGGWRALGIASTKNSATCDSAGGTHSLIPGAISWIESASGVDVTPCHDVNGNWDPSPLCGGFLTSGATGTGSYNTWCQGTGESGWSTTCGPGFGEQAESNPPTVTITSPADGTAFPDTEVTVPIDIDAVDDSGFIQNAQLEINGMLIPDLDEEAPWRFSNVTFPTGEYTLRAHAMDFWGNVGSSAPITIYVGDTVPSTTTSGEETTSATTDGSGTSTGTTDGSGTSAAGEDDGGTTGWNPTTTGMMLDDSGDTKGCACGVGDEDGGAAGLFGLGVLFAFRRRRR